MLDRRRLSLEPIGKDPEVGRWLAALDEARSRTLREVEGISAGLVDHQIDGPLATIGSLLYHVALIEADWIANDILELDDPPELGALLPWPDRASDGSLTVVRGLSLDDHLARLAEIRAFTTRSLSSMRAADFHRLRHRPRDDVAPDWVIHHLLQHEAEHRSHIAWIRDTA